MSGCSGKSIIEKLKEFIKTSPYPSYEEMCERILHSNFSIKSSEYGNIQHKACKIIYENFTDRYTVRKMGEKINKHGGFKSLQACFYIMLHFSPFKDISLENHELSTFPVLLDLFWNRIGEKRILE